MKAYVVRQRHRARSAVAALATMLLIAAGTACGSSGADVPLDSTTIAGPSSDTLATAPTTATTAPEPTTSAAEETSAASTTPTIATAPPGETAPFPLHLDDSNRVVRPDGSPFLMVGDAAWSLITALTDDEVITYLDDRAARGFNTLLVNLIEHKFSPDPPADMAGNLPFTGAPFATPNEAYFARADWVLQQAADRGFVVVLTAAYAGYEGGDEGWYSDMKAAGVDTLSRYGTYIGERYRSFDNIIWAGSGDYTPPEPELIDAVQNAIAAADPDALQTGHGDHETAAADDFGDAPWLTLNSVYSQYQVYALSLAQYQAGNVPYFMIEGSYENEHDVTTAGIRAQAYGAMLAGAFGQIFGNNPMWHFDGPGLYDVGVTWQEALDSPGSRSMTVLAQFFAGLEWWRLVPSVSGGLVVNEPSGDPSPAAIADDGSFAVVYVPGSRVVDLDLNAIGSGPFQISWGDPSDGSVHGTDTATPTAGTAMSVDVNATNADGATDWLLLIQREGG